MQQDLAGTRQYLNALCLLLEYALNALQSTIILISEYISDFLLNPFLLLKNHCFIILHTNPPKGIRTSVLTRTEL